MSSRNCGADGMDSNLQPLPYDGSALPLELRRQGYQTVRVVVCAAGFEPATPRFQGANSTPELRTEMEGRGRAADFMTDGV